MSHCHIYNIIPWIRQKYGTLNTKQVSQISVAASACALCATLCFICSIVNCLNVIYSRLHRGIIRVCLRFSLDTSANIYLLSIYQETKTDRRQTAHHIIEWLQSTHEQCPLLRTGAWWLRVCVDICVHFTRTYTKIKPVSFEYKQRIEESSARYFCILESDMKLSSSHISIMLNRLSISLLFCLVTLSHCQPVAWQLQWLELSCQLAASHET